MRGTPTSNPDLEVEAAYQRRQRDEADRRDRPAGNRDREPVTVDGIRVELLANVNGPDDTALASRVGAGGVGLYRTEYLFLTHPGMPDEEEQLAAYRAVVEAAPGRTVTIRALDLGADKSVSYLGRRDEPNPALGFRGTRLLSASPELAQTHLRAILRAGRYGRVSLLLPMVSALEEVRWAKGMLDDARLSLRRQGEPFADDMPLGVMVEVPAAVACLDDLLEEVDFVSIGTNDLIQYTLAADRNNASVREYYDQYHPAILHSIKRVADAAKKAGKKASLCGEMAADPLCALLLTGMGVRDFSLSAPSIPVGRPAIRSNSFEACRRLAKAALACRNRADMGRCLATARKKLVL